MKNSRAPSLLRRVGAVEYTQISRAPDHARVETALAGARDWLVGHQRENGSWCATLEGDTTVESYWILVDAFLQRQCRETVEALAHTILQRMLPEGGWSQYPGGPVDVSVSTLSYFALKLAGERADAPQLRRSRDAIVTLGGVEATNTYTRYHLALFGQYSWDDVPAIPPEMVLLPESGPFSIYDMSSWSRTIFVPLSILYAYRPVREIAPERGVSELFVAARRAAEPQNVGARPSHVRALGSRPLPEAGNNGTVNAKIARTFFHGVDRFLKRFEPLAKRSPLRRRALERAAAWTLERFSDSEGLSAILPAMSNSILAASCLGYPQDGALVARELEHLDALLVRDEESGAVQMQPCLSPVWDTVLAAHALIQCGAEPQHPALRRAASWLLRKQCRVPGDWVHRNGALPGGWYFENLNERYPDVDDTCMALMVLQRARAHEPESVQRDAVARGLAWMLGMQNRDGGFASFDRDNDKRWLTFIPFADHNAMIDPSTADITGRVLESLSYFPQFDTTHPVVRRAVAFLRKDQQADGSWFGRWGVNHIYGTWQVLRGLSAIGADMSERWVGNAAEWLLAHQNEDGGWGESIASYADASQRGKGPSNPAQTAWGLMGLLAVQTPDHAAVRRAVAYLLEQQDATGTWRTDAWVGTGFPRVFYLNYHGYAHYFPLMALGQYRRARSEAVAPRSATAARAPAEIARRPA